MTPAVCLDPAKAQKNLIQTPNSLQNHQQRRASAGKSCLGRYPANHARLLQRIPRGSSRARQGGDMTKDGWFVPPVVIHLGFVLAYLGYLAFFYLHKF